MADLELRTAAIVVSLAAVTALGAGVTASQQEADSYVVEQGGRCTALTPLSPGDQSVQAFYGYSVEGSSTTVAYSANTPLDIEETNDDASTLFLYRGPDQLALVVVHDAVNGSGGGAATYEFSGLPEGGEWVVRDDPANESVEVWDRTTDGGTAVDWGWRGAYTDGGAFAWDPGESVEIEISAAFGEDAALDPITPGNITRWRALSGGDGTTYESVELDVDEPVTVRSGTCS